jgi:SAM-dependent methyltransferase
MALDPNAKLPADRLEAFRTLHEQGWLGEHETRSGTGSMLMYTRNLRAGLQPLLDIGMFSSVLDIGCGDCNWISAINLRGARYLGVDIVPSIIADNEARLTEPHVRFAYLDIMLDAPPRHDLVICRDLFSHFPAKDVAVAFNRIKESHSRMIAISNFVPMMMNHKLQTQAAKGLNSSSPHGYWRAVSMRHYPFMFPAPLISIAENQPGKTLDIWKLDDLPPLDVEGIAARHLDNPTTPEEFNRYDFFRRLCALPFVEKIEIHGSRAVGTHRPDSDIDLLLHCEASLSKEDWLKVCDIVSQPDTFLAVECAFAHDKGVDQGLLKNKTKLLYERPRHT